MTQKLSPCQGDHVGDAVEFEVLAREARSMLLSLALRLTHNRHEAEDLVQATLERALHNFPPKHNKNHRAWLRKILRHLFVDGCRRLQRQPTNSLDDITVLPAPIPEEEPAWARITPRHLRRAVAELPHKYRRPFELQAQGWSYRDIADELRIPCNTVGTLLRQARLKLRELLLNELGDEGGSQ